MIGDLADGCTGARVWRSGPDENHQRAPLQALMRKGRRFHMMDKDGKVRFHGYIVGEFTGREPLEDYGQSHGCVNIKWG